ncbi:hypothetical protein [Rhodanobacter spathiphylli]|uniref:hypothetical protein n=1 Tax=Rhodanobacter spathiphylli TaxID=347483 RepID=UPI0012F7CF24|nr:hypothetical protein [Rhodanobacter spathiphylli]
MKDMAELQGLNRVQRVRVGKLLFWLALGHWLTWIGVVSMAVLVSIIYQASHYSYVALLVAGAVLGIGCNKLVIFVLRRKYSDDVHKMCRLYDDEKHGKTGA